MRRVFLAAWLAGAVCLFAAPANAANQIDFFDGLNDVGPAPAAPDVGRVRVANLNSGHLTFQIELGNGVGSDGLDVDDQIDIFIDADTNKATGNGGAEYDIQFDGSVLNHVHVYRWTGSAWDGSVPQSSLSRSWQNPYLSVGIHRNELGLGPGFNRLFDLNIRTEYAPSGGSLNNDFAPGEFTWWRYQILTPDTVAPTVRAFRVANAVPGREVTLPYAPNDNSGEARTEFWIYRDGRQIAHFLGNFHGAQGATWDQPWTAPRAIRGKQRYCVRSRDRAGLVSGKSCAALLFPFDRIKPDRPQPLLASSAGTSRIIKFRIGPLPRFARVSIKCVRSCNGLFTGTEVRNSRRKSFVTSRKFADKRVNFGVQFVVRAAKPRWVGYYGKLTFVRDFEWRRVQRCLPPGRLNAAPRRCGSFRTV